jgi:hypothetical protein
MRVTLTEWGEKAKVILLSILAHCQARLKLIDAALKLHPAHAKALRDAKLLWKC